MLSNFQNPPAEFGPVPFWWWVGEKLDRDRIAWQLDQLKAKGVRNAIVSYNHHADGANNPGDPPIFSAEWWELFRWVVAACRERGMQISFQDYTIINPLLQQIGRETPEMNGAGTLREAHVSSTRGRERKVDVPAGAPIISARAFPIVDGQPVLGQSIDVSSADGQVCFPASSSDVEWLVSVVWLQRSAYDPMHPRAGDLLIEGLYAPFEKHCPGELGRTIPILFQDELDFGTRMPMWSSRIEAEFSRRKGYDLREVLHALWHPLGPTAPKVRIDYADVVTQLLEECYFKPVFDWCESRGVLLGNDNNGRGNIEDGRNCYGDYFRTMRWFSAPGTDDPNLSQARAFKGLKVNSSIAHLYGRPRVWNECFHSSGWGTTPAQVVAALNEDFAYGATVVNLHGLYYSTFGSWWEWAPPDFHFRQPYWEHTDALSGYATRLSWLLSQGDHVCDVAIVYPVTSIEGGLGRRIAESEESSGHLRDESEVHAFGLGKRLVESAIDFDFIDFESIERSTCGGRELRAGREAYRVLILPAMSAVRFSTLQKARELCEAGGVVIAFGTLPIASEKAGANDPEIDAIVRAIFGADAGAADATVQKHRGGGIAAYVPDGYAAVEDLVSRLIDRDIRVERGETSPYVLHRRLDDAGVYYLFNPSRASMETSISVRASGAAEKWDAWTGSASPWPGAPTPDGRTTFDLTLQAQEATVLVVRRKAAASEHGGETAPHQLHVESTFVSSERSLDGAWRIEIVPTMDNRFGDFRFPSGGTIGVEARRLRFAEEIDAASSATWHNADFDDGAWPEVTYSFGQRLWRLGPIPPELAANESLASSLAALRRVDPAVPVVIDGEAFHWQPYDMSLRWGIERDPFLMNGHTGPHGLKGAVPDEYVDLHCDRVGAVWFLWTSLDARSSEEGVPLVAASRSAYDVWLNGVSAVRQRQALPAGRYPAWGIQHYESTPQRATVELRAGPNPLLMRFVQSADQRVRAYVTIDREAAPATRDALALRWFADGQHPTLNCRPERPMRAGWYRVTLPPGCRTAIVAAKGHVRAWHNGHALSCETLSIIDGVRRVKLDATSPVDGPSLLAIRVEPPPGSFGGDPIVEPIQLECAEGAMPVGNWCDFGLATYSGTVVYRRSVELSAADAAGPITLDLGDVAATAKIRLNGQPLATLIAPPWRVDLSTHARVGENLLEIEVANTLANHYSVGVPTPYVFAGQTRSGLLGPVTLTSTGRRDAGSRDR